MTRNHAILLILHILAFPPLAFLPVLAGMNAGWHAVLWSGSLLGAQYDLPLAVAAAGALASAPMLALGYAATRRWPLVLGPVAATVAGLLVMGAVPGLFPMRPVDALTILAAGFLLLAIVPYGYGIWRLFVLPLRHRRPS